MKIMFRFINDLSNFLSGTFLGRFLGKIPGIFRMERFLFNLTNPNDLILIELNNYKMYVNSSDAGVALPLIKKGVYGEFLTEIVKNLIKSDTTMIDIGANIGYFTLIAASLINEGVIYSFEPVNNNHSLLAKNIALNKFKNVETFEKAVSNKNGNVKIFIDRKNLGNHSLAKHNVPDMVDFIEVETITIDSFFQSDKIVTENILIKMDTQGAEGLVIEGAHDLLLNNNNIKILLEFWPKGLRNMDTNPLELLNKLEDYYGFNIRLIDDETKSLKYINKNDVIEFCDDPEGAVDQLNLLLEKGN